MDEQQEHHERVVYQLDAIEKRLLQLDTRTICLTRDIKRIEAIVADARALIVGTGKLFLLYLGYLLISKIFWH